MGRSAARARRSARVVVTVGRVGFGAIRRFRLGRALDGSDELSTARCCDGGSRHRAGMAGLRVLRFHALRHGAGSRVARHADPAGSFLGHSKLTPPRATSTPRPAPRTSSASTERSRSATSIQRRTRSPATDSNPQPPGGPGRSGSVASCRGSATADLHAEEHERGGCQGAAGGRPQGRDEAPTLTAAGRRLNRCVSTSASGAQPAPSRAKRRDPPRTAVGAPWRPDELGTDSGPIEETRDGPMRLESSSEGKVERDAWQSRTHSRPRTWR